MMWSSIMDVPLTCRTKELPPRAKSPSEIVSRSSTASSGRPAAILPTRGSSCILRSVKEQVTDRKMQELPLVGRIAAGRPLEAVEERETISLGDFARGGNSFVLQVKGTSMIEDHI